MPITIISIQGHTLSIDEAIKNLEANGIPVKEVLEANWDNYHTVVARAPRASVIIAAPDSVPDTTDWLILKEGTWYSHSVIFSVKTTEEGRATFEGGSVLLTQDEDRRFGHPYFAHRIRGERIWNSLRDYLMGFQGNH